MARLAIAVVAGLFFAAAPAAAGAEETPTAPGEAGTAGATGPNGPAETGRPPVRASLPDLEDEVMCPICGTLLGLSRAPAAERQRVFIRKLIREGRTSEEIKDELVAEYGQQVLALPEGDGINVWAYAVPLIGLVAGAAGVGWVAFRWRRGRREGTPGDVDALPAGDESERLDRELDEFDR
jgi:cytochrome c-type biogenesis protein CcmH